jgi:uncharacterized protein (TIGR03000 family)
MFVPPTSLRYPGIPYVPPPSYYLSNPVNRPGFINPPVSPPGPAVSSPSTINPENTLLRPLSSFREGTLLTEAPAFLEIRVPPDAELRIGNFQARQTGEVRYFVSPPLPRGREYTYEIRARWQKNGKDVVRTRQVDVWAGARKIVDFTEGNEES